MAVAISKKDKLLEEAQRLVMRGQFDRAAKTYGQVLALDPSAVTLRQKLAELLVKAGRNDDARAEFDTIGRYYAGHGFYLKAIAVYKQLQKLFPQDISITMTLAELNGKHGLVGNALAEYKQVFDYYEQSSNGEEALKILARMQEVDPGNVTIKLKLGESYFQAAKKDDAYATFVRLALLLQERDDNAALVKLNTRVQQLFPEKTGFMLEVLTEQVNGGNAARAVHGIQTLLRNDPGDKRSWELMTAAFRKLNQLPRLKAVYQHYLKFFPEEVSPRKGLLQCLVAERDVKGGLALLAGYEQELIRAGAAADLVEIYRGFEEIDPMNVRVLEGLKRAYEAAGDRLGAETLEPKLASCRAISTKGKPSAAAAQDAGAPPVEPGRSVGRVAGQPETEASTGVSLVGAASAESSAAATSPVLDDSGLSDPRIQDAVEADMLPYPDEDDIEIDIEIDIDEETDFDYAEQDNPALAAGDNWLDSFGEIFDSIATSSRGIKFGCDLDTADAQSHHDLGVAFREMGLYDEAINEFRQAAQDPARKVECRVLQGACLRQKGDPATAEQVLRSLLVPGLTPDEMCLVTYELATSLISLGKNDEAVGLLAEVDAVNPGFRDGRSRLDDAGADDLLEFSDDDLKDFELK